MVRIMGFSIFTLRSLKIFLEWIFGVIGQKSVPELKKTR